MIESINNFKTYCSSLTRYSRYKTKEVTVGDIPLGGDNPIRIQSMTTTDTMDTRKTVEQTIRMVESGCEYVRITAPSIKEAKNLEVIKKELRSAGYNVPLIADIHFTPNAAEMAARIVEKVRVNPGNYADKKKFDFIEYTDAGYEEELERIRKKFLPLIKICKEYGTAMRIGTNHGSLSDRIMSRFGDSPLGMVESALEFVRICEEENYYNIVLSMKSSNPQVMVQAYRLLVQKMELEGMNYPLHLGVTEAGGGEDGRIKSAAGIGALLEDGLGDTIRVSLTEDPEFEAPVAVYLADRYKSRDSHKFIKPVNTITYNPLEYSRRNSEPVLNIGSGNVPVVFADYSSRELSSPAELNDIGYTYNARDDKWHMSDTAADYVFTGNKLFAFSIPNGLKPVYAYTTWLAEAVTEGFPLLTPEEYMTAGMLSDKMNFILIDIDSLNDLFTKKLSNDKTAVLVLDTFNEHGMAEQRRVFIELQERGIQTPVIIRRKYSGINTEQLMLFASTDCGSLLLDGFGDGVWLEYDGQKDNTEEYVRSIVKKESKEKLINRLIFGILQAARVRISKTEYIACPSCGRTLFDLQETTEMIRKRTEHLKGIKIAIMGCIVNGPGEMADADYGYVGSGVDKISLYKGKDIVRKNIPSGKAVEALIEIIKEDAKWVDPAEIS